MRFILTALIFLAGLFDLWLGAGFLFTPTTAAAGFGLTPNGPMGLAVTRADFTSFFWVAAVCMMVGAWRRSGDLLLAPAALFGVAFSGRLVSVFADGTAPGFWMPMTVEAFHVVVLIAAWRLLPHHKVSELTG